MLTYVKEKTSTLMGTGPTSVETNSNEEFAANEALKKTLSPDGLNRHKHASDLIFFAGTDKASVISEILEERGWSRTKDHSVTNFTIKWCLAHQVDWDQFQEGKQLINNIPGQLAFTDKINLWYTIRNYLHHRHSLDGNHIQTFLPMTFVLDDEDGIADFLCSYRKHTRTWICKPRYNYAGRGIYILSGSSELNTIFKFKVGTNNRLTYEPRLPGYLMQEYIARPLLIKNRKFDIRVHWLVAWTKPLLVFYNHNASVVRLSLNLYREFDFDRATHLTNLSVQENHCRYAADQESTGMTMSQLNHYFNQCFRPFHPKMCQNWVMTVMQDRMQTIIRHVVRASKDKLTRGAGQFGLFGCDFLLDENFRIWLLEINDNPGVGWGNPRLNTSTKPLFEETLDIVFECFEKYTKDQPLLPIQCLRNYKLIYNKDDDADQLLLDDNQVFTEHLAVRYGKKDVLSRAAKHRTLPRVNTSRTSIHQNDITPDTEKNQTDNNINIILPLISATSPNSSIIDMVPPPSSSMANTTPLGFSSVDTTTSNPAFVRSTPVSLSTVNRSNDTEATIGSLKHVDDIELERLIKPSQQAVNISKPKTLVSTASTITRPIPRINKSNIKRTFSSTNTLGIQRRKRIDLAPLVIDNRRYIHRHGIIPPCTETTKKKDTITKYKILLHNNNNNNKQKTIETDNQSVLTSATQPISLESFSIN